MNLNEAKHEIIDAIDAGIAVELLSSPGRGKSETIGQIVKELSARDGKPWGLATAFLATYTPPDLIGCQFKGEKTIEGQTVTVTEPSMPLWMMTEDGKPVWYYERGILFLDEFGQAEADVKRAAAELLLNRRIGPWRLPPGWGVVAASNLITDRSGVTKSLDFVINRRKEIEITDDIDAWVDWAVQNDVMPLTIAFAKQNVHIVFTKGVPQKQGPWCTPRSLVLADKLLQVKQKRLGTVPTNPTVIEAVSGLIGAAAAAQYFAFVKLEHEMPKFEDIIKAPTKTPVPSKPDAQMLVCYNLAHRVNETNASAVVEYVERFPKEFAVTFANAACKRDYRLIRLPAFHKWAKDNASLMAAIAA